VGIPREIRLARRIIASFAAQLDLDGQQLADQPVSLVFFEAVKVGLNSRGLTASPVGLEPLAYFDNAAQRGELGRFIAFGPHFAHRAISFANLVALTDPNAPSGQRQSIPRGSPNGLEVHDTNCRRGRTSAAEDRIVRALARVKSGSAQKVWG
jgi:hypothetical protein